MGRDGALRRHTRRAANQTCGARARFKISRQPPERTGVSHNAVTAMYLRSSAKILPTAINSPTRGIRTPTPPSTTSLHFIYSETRISLLATVPMLPFFMPNQLEYPSSTLLSFLRRCPISWLRSAAYQPSCPFSCAHSHLPYSKQLRRLLFQIDTLLTFSSRLQTSPTSCGENLYIFHE